MTARHRVVIIGGGFAGLRAARALRYAPVDVTLIDRRNYHLFQPLLYQVATGSLSPGQIAAPIRAVLSRQKNTRVLMGDVVDIDPAAKRVVLADGAEIEYDSLIVAAGSQTSYYGHDEWRHWAPGMKSIEEATDIRHKILYAFEVAERLTDPAERQAWLRLVIVGAGPTGVELDGAIWAGGVTVPALGRTLASRTKLETDRIGRIKVNPDLTIPNHPDIYVVGDLALASGPDGNPLPRLAQVAMQGGTYAAKAIVRKVEGAKPLPPFKYFGKGELAVIGRAAAVANVFGRHISGLPAWLIWAFVHLMYIVQFRSRLTVFIEWAIEDLTFNRGARLITGSAPADFDFNKEMASEERRRPAA